jgi:hypothetical protein
MEAGLRRRVISSPPRPRPRGQWKENEPRVGFVRWWTTALTETEEWMWISSDYGVQQQSVRTITTTTPQKRLHSTTRSVSMNLRTEKLLIKQLASQIDYLLVYLENSRTSSRSVRVRSCSTFGFCKLELADGTRSCSSHHALIICLISALCSRTMAPNT